MPLQKILKGLRFSFIILLICAAGKISYDLVQTLHMESRGPMDADALIYLTIGRAILNGSKVYVDFFESKPPAIFYLSALSLRLGGTGLMRFLEILSILLVPGVLTISGWRRSRLLALVSFVFGG